MIIKNKRLDFFIKAIILTLFCVLFDVIDRALNLGGFLFAFIKIIALLFVLFSIKDAKEKLFEKFKPKYLIFVVISFVFTFILCYAKTEFLSGYFNFFKSVVFLIITIFLEEFFFRSYAVFNFDEQGVISLKNAYLIILVFTLCNIPVLMFNNFSVSLLIILYSFALDTFILGIYLSSKNIILCILCSFFTGGTEIYFSCFSNGSLLFGSWIFYLISALQILFYFCVGSIFIMRNTVRK